MYMDRLKCLNELTTVSLCVVGGVGTNLRPLQSIDVSGFGMGWLVRLTMRLLFMCFFIFLR